MIALQWKLPLLACVLMSHVCTKVEAFNSNAATAIWPVFNIGKPAPQDSTLVSLKTRQKYMWKATWHANRAILKQAKDQINSS